MSANQLRDRSVGTWGVIGQALAVGPIFSAGFVSLAVAVAAGFNTPLSVLLAAVGTVALGYVVMLYARRYAGAGAVYEYLVRATHPALGIIGGGMYVVGLLFLGGGAFLTEGYLTNGLLSSQLSIGVGWAPGALVALLAAIALNVVGVRIGLRAILYFAGLSAIPLIAIAVAVIASGGADGNSLAVFDPGQTSFSSVFHGMLFAVALFIGFESAAVLGEEARLPRRSIPLAMMTTILLCAGFYVLLTYAAAIGFGKAAIARGAWISSTNPFGDLGDRYLVHGMGWIVSLTIILDLFSVCMAFTLGASRVLMALSRDGLLPRAVATTSRRFGTPVGGLAVVFVWALATIAFAALIRYSHPTDGSQLLQTLVILLSTGTYLITLVYLLLAGGCVRLLRAYGLGPRLWWRAVVVVVAIAVPILSLDGSLNPFPSYPGNLGVALAAASVAITVLWCLALAARNPAIVRAAAGYAEPPGVVIEPERAVS